MAKTSRTPLDALSVFFPFLRLQAAAGRAAAVTAAAEELTALMKGDEECQRYARTCKALDGLIAQLTGVEALLPGQSSTTTIPVLRALHAACLNDKNQQVRVKKEFNTLPGGFPVGILGCRGRLHVDAQTDL